MKSLLFALAIGAAVGLLLASTTGTRQPALGRDATWSAYHYEVIDTEQIRDFDLVLPVQGGDAGQTKPAFRLLLHFQDRSSYNALTVTDREVELITVQGGLVVDKQVQPVARPATEAEEFRLCWRDPHLRLVCNRQEAARFVLPNAQSGRVGLGRTASAGTVGPLRIEPVTPIAYADDFMRAPHDDSPWRPTTDQWGVRTIDNPSRSANAFVYQCVTAPEGSCSLIGTPTWNNYALGVSFQGNAGGAVGLLFHARDAENGFLLRWSARASGTTDTEEAAGRLQLLQRVAGKDTVLAQEAGGYRPGQWYRLAVTAVDGRALCEVDGHTVFRIAHPELTGGCAGLYAWGPAAVEFDDFQARTYAGALALPEQPSRTVLRTKRGAALYGQRNWHQYALTARIQPGPPVADRVLVQAYPFWQSPRNHVIYELGLAADGSVWQSLRRRQPEAAEPVELARHNLVKSPFPLNAKLEGEPGQIRLSLVRGVVQVQVNRERSIEAWVGDEAAGLAGFFGVSAPRHHRVSIEPVDPPLPVATINEVFDEEKLMAIWSGTSGDWRPGRQAASGYTQVYWHRALFYGDTEIEALLTDRQGTPLTSPREESEIALSLAKPRTPTEKGNGYTLRYLPQNPEGPALLLTRSGVEIRRHILPAESAPRRLRLRQQGGVLVASTDDKPVLVHHDPEPLVGQKVAWAANHIDLAAEQVSVFNQNLRSYSFNQAAVDWRIGAGVWEVTNRWECDPRWSFFAGMPGRLAALRIKAFDAFLSDGADWKIQSLRRQFELLPDKEDPHAILWYKGALEGEFMVEFYVSQMMDNSRGGGNYDRYVRDFNITVCADGRDLNSGYSCIFGGWGNKRSAILRAGREVAESGDRLHLRGSHRRWVRVRVEREGNTLFFSAYTEEHARVERRLLALQYEDPDPLPGRHIAVWSYDNGIHVTRARLSAEHPGPRENPFASWPAHVKSIYTMETADAE